MRTTFRKITSTAAALAFAASFALPALAQEKPEGAAAAPKMEKKAPAKKAPAKKTAKKKAGSPKIMALQTALKKAGENPGTIDGKIGPKTRSALRAFQKKNKLKVTGRADKMTMAKLEPFMSK